jgi:hypothetical protein
MALLNIIPLAIFYVLALILNQRLIIIYFARPALKKKKRVP